jgi:hypothetical protein
MFKKFFLLLLVLVVAFLIVVAMRPDNYLVSRTTSMKAPASVIFAEVNDLSKWHAWSPWAKMDPEAKTTFEGPESGMGAIMKWAGNYEVGEGTMEIIESKQNEFIKFKLTFEKPFKGNSTSEFSFKEENGETMVTWSMYGHNDFMGKAFGLLFNCEKMITEKEATTENAAGKMMEKPVDNNMMMGKPAETMPMMEKPAETMPAEPTETK